MIHPAPLSVLRRRGLRPHVSPETITPDTTFVDDLGADSLDIFQIIMGIEEDFDIEIDNEEAEKITTVQDAVDQIQKKKANE